MPLQSALEDLRSTTLITISGSLRKLEYLAALRTLRGGYEHWGLARVHGELAAAKAIEQEHRLVLAMVLATPLEVLLEDVEHSSQLVKLTPLQYLAKLKRDPRLLPPNPSAGSREHLSSVLDALSCLIQNRPAAIPLIS